MMAGSVAVLGVMTAIAFHGLYRAGFAASFGTDFVATGLGQRLLWDGLLLGGAVLLWKYGRGVVAQFAAPAVTVAAALHLTWCSLLLRDPLWMEQAVGGISGREFDPAAVRRIAALRAPAHADAAAARGEDRPRAPAGVDGRDRPVRLGDAAPCVPWHAAGRPGPGPVRGHLAFYPRDRACGRLFAVGHSHASPDLAHRLAAAGDRGGGEVFILDTSGLEGLLRIASFIALGFSLIGIGWLYSRQLRSEEA